MSGILFKKKEYKQVPVRRKKKKKKKITEETPLIKPRPKKIIPVKPIVPIEKKEEPKVKDDKEEERLKQLRSIPKTKKLDKKKKDRRTKNVMEKIHFSEYDDIVPLIKETEEIRKRKQIEEEEEILILEKQKDEFERLQKEENERKERERIEKEKEEKFDREVKKIQNLYENVVSRKIENENEVMDEDEEVKKKVEENFPEFNGEKEEVEIVVTGEISDNNNNNQNEEEEEEIKENERDIGIADPNIYQNSEPFSIQPLPSEPPKDTKPEEIIDNDTFLSENEENNNNNNNNNLIEPKNDKKIEEEEEEEDNDDDDEPVSIHICGNSASSKELIQLLSKHLKDRNIKSFLVEEQENRTPYRNYILKNPKNPNKLFDIHIRINTDSLTPMPDENKDEMSFLKNNSNTRSAIYVHITSGMIFSTYIREYGNSKIHDKWKDFDSGVFLNTFHSRKDDFFFVQNQGNIVLQDKEDPEREKALKECFEVNMNGLCDVIEVIKQKKHIVEEVVKNGVFLD